MFPQMGSDLTMVTNEGKGIGGRESGSGLQICIYRK